MQLLQIVTTIVFYAWLFAVAYLLYQHAVGAGAQSRRLMTLLAESNQQSAQAAHEAAQAALQLAELLRKRND